jgi:hypothetical protein
MFAMDCAAMTGTDVSNFIEDFIEDGKKRTILISDILSRYPVTTQESPCSWIALEEARHFFEVQESVGAATEVSVINSGL